MGQPFNVEQPAVGLKADLPQRGEILEPLADADVPGIVDRGLGAQRAALLVVLLDARSFVVDVQRGGDALGEDAGAEAAGGAAGDAAAEDQLHLVGAADVEVLADDLLEEDAAGGGAVEHLGEGELGLQDGDVVAVAGPAIGGGEGMRQPARATCATRASIFAAERPSQSAWRGAGRRR